METPHSKKKPTESESIEIRSALISAEREVSGASPAGETQVALLSAHSLDSQDREQLAALFDVAAEALVDPQIESYYVDLDKLSAHTILGSQNLARALKRVERFFAAPLEPSGAFVRASSLTSAAHTRPVLRNTATKIVPASPRQRILSSVINLLLCVPPALICGIAIEGTTTGGITQTLAEISEGEILRIVSVLIRAAQAFLVIATAYPLAAFLLGRKSAGYSMLRLKIWSDSGNPPSREQMVIHSFMQPLAWLTLSAFFPYFKGKGLAERLSGTQISKM